MLDLLFQNLDQGEMIELRSVQDKTSIQRAFFDGSKVGWYESIQEWARERAAANVFYSVCTRRDKKPCRAFAVWADIDWINPDVACHDNEAKYLWAPTYVVSSGHGTHLYWRLTQPTSDMDKVGETVSEIITCIGAVGKVGADSAVKDVTRMMRLPGTMNWKDPAKPVPALLREDLSRPTLSYELNDLLAMAKLPPRMVSLVRTGSTKGYHSRSERDYAVLNACVAVGLSDTAIIQLFTQYAIGDKLSERGGDAYLAHSLEQTRLQAVSQASNPFQVVEDDDGTYIKRKLVATFTFEPQRLVTVRGKGAKEEDVLNGTMRAAGYTWPDVEIPRSAFNRTDALNKHLPKGFWVWQGKDLDCITLLQYYMTKIKEDGIPTAVGTTQLGRHEQGWLTETALITNEGIIPRATAPLVYIDTGATHPRSEYVEVEYESILKAFASMVGAINDANVVWPVLGWCIATMYKPQLEALGSRFPILNVSGTRGSGKTSMISLFLRALGCRDLASYDADTTDFVFLTLMGSTTTIPVFMAEFRALQMRSAPRLVRTVLRAYDRGEDARGHPDQTTTVYPLSAPIIIDGEDVIMDPAGRERLVSVVMRPDRVKEGMIANATFKYLDRLSVQNLALPLVRFALKTEAEPIWLQAEELLLNAFPENLPPRVRRNMAVSVFGLCSLAAFCEAEGTILAGFEATSDWVRRLYLSRASDGLDDEELGEDEAIDTSSGEMVANTVNLASGRAPLQFDTFVEDLVDAVERYYSGHLLAEPFINRLQEGCLWFKPTATLQWWAHLQHQRGQGVTLDIPALKHQMRERHIDVRAPETLGHYIRVRSISFRGNMHHAWGIDLAKAHDLGLAVPEQLCQNPGQIHFTSSGHIADSKNEG